VPIAAAMPLFLQQQFISTSLAMNLSIFLKHQWLQFWRSKNAGRSLAVQIIVGLFYILIVLEVVLVGLAMEYLIERLQPGKNTIAVFCSYLLYYFFIGTMARFQFQELPVLSVQPYLTLPIKRSKMLAFLHWRSVFHVLNVLPFFFLLPFVCSVVWPVYGSIASLCFIAALLSLVAANHFGVQYLKRKTVANSYWLLWMALLLLGIKWLNHMGWIKFEAASTHFFIGMLHQPLWLLLPLGFALICFWLNHRFLRKHLYVEEVAAPRQQAGAIQYQFISKLGQMGEIAALDLKLIFRNRRPRSVIILSAVVLLYGLIFYPQYIRTANYTIIFLFALLITGLFISNYGQFLFSWQSSHFDGLMCSPISMQQYLKAKFFLFALVCTIQFVLSLLYGLMSWKLIPVQVAAWLWSIGVNSFVTIYVATYNFKYINISKAGGFSMQGVGAAQWLQSLAVAFGPVLVFWLFFRLTGYWGAVAGISIAGLAGIASYRYLIRWLAGQFVKRKYQMLEGFREKG
jgi:hypothetical protein